MHRQRQLRSWLRSNAPTFLGLVVPRRCFKRLRFSGLRCFLDEVMVFNVLTLTLILASFLAHAMWMAFPTDGGHFNMSEGPDTEALGAAAALAVLTALCSLVTGGA